MKRSLLLITFALLSLVTLLGISSREGSVTPANSKMIAELPARANQDPESPENTLKPSAESKNLSPRISFKETVFDLGDVGQGTKSTCEFRFTNTGRGLLKIGKISRTCGCTVFHLDKKEYKTRN